MTKNSTIPQLPWRVVIKILIIHMKYAIFDKFNLNKVLTSHFQQTIFEIPQP